MSQHDYNIANGGGAAVRADINLALAAILSQNSGATAPTITKPFMLWYDTANSLIKMRNAADNAWLDYMNSSGQLVAPTATGLITALGGQIKFPASQNASADANTLDDYEEGTFTPSSGVGLSSATGKYTKVGRAVHIEMEVVFPVTSSTAGAGITGLPFAASADNYACAVWTNKGAAIFAFVPASSSSVNLYNVTTGGIYDYVDFSNKSVKVAGTYFI